MYTITFRGKQYDANKLVAQATIHSEQVDTSKISTLISAKSYQKRIAIKVDDVYHLLTGDIDNTLSTNSLSMINKHILKKAEKIVETYEQRSNRYRDPEPEFKRSFSRDRNGQQTVIYRQPRF